MDKPTQSGQLKIDDKDIVYSIDGKESWRIPAISICAIGEYTTTAGPYEDDFFLVFVMEGGKWHQASFYVEGRDTFLSDLSKFFGELISPGLCTSTQWDSRVLWPKDLEGKELFSLDTKGSGNFLSRLRKIISGGGLKLSPQVKKLTRQSPH